MPMHHSNAASASTRVSGSATGGTATFECQSGNEAYCLKFLSPLFKFLGSNLASSIDIQFYPILLGSSAILALLKLSFKALMLLEFYRTPANALAVQYV